MIAPGRPVGVLVAISMCARLARLLGTKPRTMKELSKELGVSMRTMRRYMQYLRASGIKLDYVHTGHLHEKAWRLHRCPVCGDHFSEAA